MPNRSAMLNEYLEEFINSRTEYEDDTNDAIHIFTDNIVSSLRLLECTVIIDSCGGVIKCIKNYINNYGEMDFDKDESKIYRTLCYLCINDYITENYTDAESDNDEDNDIILLESNMNTLDVK
jgi:hypothetical protein